jgi:hypothetical protein
MTAAGEIFARVDERLAVGLIARLQSYERMPSGDPVKFPALAAFDEGITIIEEETGTVRIRHRLIVEGYEEGVGGAATHNDMLQLHADACFSLLGDPGQNLNLPGKVESIAMAGGRREATRLADKRRVGFAQDFDVTYAIQRGNPANFA